MRLRDLEKPERLEKPYETQKKIEKYKGIGNKNLGFIYIYNRFIRFKTVLVYQNQIEPKSFRFLHF